MKSLFNFFEIWTTHSTDFQGEQPTHRNGSLLGDLSDAEDDSIKQISVLFLQIWTVINHSALVHQEKNANMEETKTYQPSEKNT